MALYKLKEKQYLLSCACQIEYIYLWVDFALTKWNIYNEFLLLFYDAILK
jgi:hypothetical protein